MTKKYEITEEIKKEIIRVPDSELTPEQRKACLDLIAASNKIKEFIKKSKPLDPRKSRDADT